MLVTIARGKAGRIRLPGSEANASWRDLFKQYEDLLTGAFFGRIRYLSAPLFTQVIELLIGSTNARMAGGLKDFEFWPDLIGLEGRSRVQPDVLINLDNAAILIEVKPPKGPGQAFTQWYEQLNAFAAECRNEHREAPPLVHYVALGRNAQPQAADPDDPLDFGEAAELLDLTIHRLEWGQVVASVSTWLTKARYGELKVTRSDVAVLEDLVKCLGLFGVRLRNLLPWSHLSDWTTEQDLRLRKSALGYASLKSVVPERCPCPITWGALADYANKNPLENFMSIDIETAGKLMQDVQVAHRVVVGFYQRIIPLLDHISESMDFDFSYWRPLYTTRPAVGTKKPSKNWLWDMVPLYASRHVYKRVAGGGLQTSDRAIVFDIEVDEGFNTARKHGEPDPIQFEAGAARLYIDLYRASKESDEAFETLWNKAGNADRNRAEWHSVADHLEARSLGFDLAEFISDHKSVVDKLRELLVPTERIGFSDGVGPA